MWAIFWAARQWALPLWIIGVSLFAIRLALAWRHVAQLRRAGETAAGEIADAAAALAHRMNVVRPVRVLVSTLADAPGVIGWLRPAILMPAAALAGLDPAQLQAILAHELAHIRRHDYLVNTLQTVVETLLFYHPAVWWVSSRMRNERELCCDDLAVRHCGDAIGYARALTRLERLREMPQPAVAANGGSLLYRVQRLTGAVRECAPSRLPVVLAVFAVAVCAPLVVHRAQAGQQQDEVRRAPISVAAHDQDPASGDQVFITVQDRNDFAVESQPGRTNLVQYPPPAVEKGITGTVLIEASLDGEGNVVDARVVLGPVELRKAALRSVLEWTLANATAGEVRQVKIEFGPKQLAEVRAQRVEGRTMSLQFERGFAQSLYAPGHPEMRAEELRQAEQAQAETKVRQALENIQVQRSELTMKFLERELEQARQRLAESGDAQKSNELQAQVADIERKIEAAQEAMSLQERTTENHIQSQRMMAEAAEINAKRDQFIATDMNDGLAVLQEQLRTLQQTYEPNSPEIKARQAQIAAADAALARLMAGRKLVRIEGGLPAGAELPPGAEVQIGDTLTEDSIRAIAAAVQAIRSAPYRVEFIPVNETEVAIRITKR